MDIKPQHIITVTVTVYIVEIFTVIIGVKFIKQLGLQLRNGTSKTGGSVMSGEGKGK